MWIEPHFLKHEQLSKILSNDFNFGYDFYIFKSKLSSVKELLREYIIFENYLKTDLSNQIQKQFTNTNDKYFFNETYFMLFVNSSKHIDFFKNWWSEIKQGCIIDELTFYILTEKYNIKIENLYNENFVNDISLNKIYFLTQKSLNNKINYINKILWINLDRSPDRKVYMENILNKISIPNFRISAIDGSNFNFKENFKNIVCLKDLTKYEKACLASHLKAIVSLKNDPGEYFMICEDDVSFENIFLIDNDLKNIIESSPKFDILMIYKTWFKPIEEQYAQWNKYSIPNIESISGTVSYIISKSGVQKICSMVEYENDIFTFSGNNVLDVADEYLYRNVNTYVYKYNFMSTVGTDSTIHPNHLTQHDISKQFQLAQIFNGFFT
jgi:GR25 family glycosyltransferase involved in LPS biosynthesis